MKPIVLNKLIAVFLVLFLFLSVPTAAHPSSADFGPGSLTIVMAYDGKALEGFGVSICRVADIKRQADGALFCELTGDFAASEVDVSWLITNKRTILETSANIVISEQFETFAETNVIARTSKSTDSNGRAVFASLTAGLYLVSQTNSARDDYLMDAFLISVPINNVKETGWIFNVITNPKTELKLKPSPTPEPVITPTPTEGPSPTLEPTITPTVPAPTDPPTSSIATPTPEASTSPTPGTQATPTPGPETTPDPTPATQPTPGPEEPETPEYPDTPEQPGTTTETEEPGEPTPPAPSNPNHRLERQEDGSYLLVDEFGTPLGRWHYDEADEVWIFEDMVPLARVLGANEEDDTAYELLPQTGMLKWPIPVLTSVGVLFFAAGIFFIIKGKGKRGDV